MLQYKNTANQEVPARPIGAKIGNPYRYVSFLFIGVMLIGSLLLSLPIATRSGESTPYIDALFTAVSAVAITGLTTVDTHLHWSTFGQIVIIVLCQLGGLGIMTFTTLVAVLFGRRIGLQDRLSLQASMEEGSFQGLIRLVKRIVFFTFTTEFVGGIIYTIQLYPYFQEQSLYYGFFQSVSAFCNAGFVFFDNTLPYKMVDDWLYTLNTSALILIGGLGFTVIFDVSKNYKRGFPYFSLHSKLMLYGSLGLVLVGVFMIGLLEWNNPATLGALSMSGKIQAIIFQAITPRSGGLATLDYNTMFDNTQLFTIWLMFIGAGPGSTGGGVKVTTIVVLLLAGLAIFKGRKEVRLFERTVPHTIVYRALTTMLFSMILVLVGTFLLASLESFSMLHIMFEVTSAFATVGLSMGITPELSTPSKMVLIVLMYAGRVGMITFIGSLALRYRRKDRINYPEGHIIV